MTEKTIIYRTFNKRPLKMNDRVSSLFLLCMIFASRIVSVAGVSCPAIAQNCSCSGDNQTLTCWGLSEVPSITGGPELDYGLTSIKFFEGNISVLDSHNLPAGLHVLEFHNNPLTNISDDAFDNITYDLNDLIISSADLRTPPPALLKLTNLKLLKITNSALEDWLSPDSLVTDGSNSTLVDSFNHALDLILSYNELSQIDFSYMPSNVYIFDLSYNKITKIRYSKDSFPPDHLSNYLELNLTGNRITTLSFDDLPPNTYTLDLRDNNISEILDSNLTRNMSMTSLYLNFNPITNISPSAFRNLNQLHLLNLEKTSLTYLPVALASLTSLSGLYLSGVRLSCPCPAPDSLVRWFDATNLLVMGDIAQCENEKFSVDLYLTIYCGKDITGSTTPKKGLVASTTPHNRSPPVSNNLVVIYLFSTILLFWLTFSML